MWKTAVFLLLAFMGHSRSVGAFEKWVAERQLEINGADGSSFNQPSDIALVAGKIYVLDSMNNRLCWFDTRGKQLGSVSGTADAPLTGSLGLGSDNRGRLFIADGWRGRILSQSEYGRPALLFAIAKEGKERGADPTGVLYFNDRLYVVDNDNHLVRSYTFEGRLEGKWGGAGEGVGQLKYPFRIAVDPLGRIGVTDVLNSRVQFFTPKGEYLSAFGVPGVVSGTLFRPAGFDIDGEGRVFVADNYFGTVQVFDPSGNLLAVLYDSAGGLLKLKSPVSLKVQRRNLYILEMEAHRVSVFTLTR